MNKKLILALSILVSLLSFKSAAQAAGQREVTITGKVIDKETNQPLEYATIAFFSKAENRIVTGGITDPNGNFSIPVATGTYDITIEFISFKKITLANRNLTASQNLGSFTLEIDAQALGEVEIIAESTHRRVTPDVEQRLINAGIRFRRADILGGAPMHLKFVLVENGDQAWSIFGSFNWTKPSFWLNHEIIVITSNPSIFSQFTNCWNMLKNEVALITEQKDLVINQS